MSSESAPAQGEATPALKTGELVELDYELWSTAPTGEPELIDTTREEVATRANLRGEGRTYGPRPHQIGGEYFPSGIENVLATAGVGHELTHEFPPGEAFGERDPKLIELFSMHEISRLPEMRRDDADLSIGTVLTINGRRGRVVSMTAARVRVDFNPPLAGRTIKGTFKVLKEIRDPAEQVRGLIDIHYGRGKEFQVEVKGHTVTVTLPDRSKFDFAWMAAKPRIVERIRSQLKPQTIQFIEEYVTPAAKETKGAPSEEKPASSPKETKGAPSEEKPTSPPKDEGEVPSEHPPAHPAHGGQKGDHAHPKE
jgi:FKBP-type peptidyl-prolyl cis-trans isomerase 2